jgi:hypothetical protein
MVTELTPSDRHLAIALFLACLTFLSARVITTPRVASFAIPDVSDDPEFCVPGGIIRYILSISISAWGGPANTEGEPDDKRNKNSLHNLLHKGIGRTLGEDAT